MYVCGKSEDGRREREREEYNNTAYGAQMTTDLHRASSMCRKMMFLLFLCVLCLHWQPAGIIAMGGQEQGERISSGIRAFSTLL